MLVNEYRTVYILSLFSVKRAHFLLKAYNYTQVSVEILGNPGLQSVGHIRFAVPVRLREISRKFKNIMKKYLRLAHNTTVALF